MGFFSKLLGRDLKSTSIQVITNLLQHLVDNAYMAIVPRPVAIDLVNNIWNKAPDVFDGKFGQSPFKLTVALYALVKGYERYQDGQTKEAILISIVNVFSEIQVNGAKYPLNSLDMELIKEADMVATKIMNKYQEDPLYIQANGDMTIYSELKVNQSIAKQFNKSINKEAEELFIEFEKQQEFDNNKSIERLEASQNALFTYYHLTNEFIAQKLIDETNILLYYYGVIDSVARFNNLCQDNKEKLLFEFAEEKLHFDKWKVKHILIKINNHIEIVNNGYDNFSSYIIDSDFDIRDISL